MDNTSWGVGASLIARQLNIVRVSMDRVFAELGDKLWPHIAVVYVTWVLMQVVLTAKNRL